jgi:hypothetical protein
MISTYSAMIYKGRSCLPSSLGGGKRSARRCLYLSIRRSRSFCNLLKKHYSKRIEITDCPFREKDLDVIISQCAFNFQSTILPRRKRSTSITERHLFILITITLKYTDRSSLWHNYISIFF